MACVHVVLQLVRLGLLGLRPRVRHKRQMVARKNVVGPGDEGAFEYFHKVRVVLVEAPADAVIQFTVSKHRKTRKQLEHVQTLHSIELFSICDIVIILCQRSINIQTMHIFDCFTWCFPGPRFGNFISSLSNDGCSYET